MKQDSALARAARLVSDGEYEKALRIYESACEAAPRDERGRCGKALAFMLMDEQSKAAECMQGVADELPEAAYPHGVIGSIMEEAGDLDAAMICYDAMIELEPYEASAYVRKARILQDVGFDAECAREIENGTGACEFDWESPRSAERLGDIFGDVIAGRRPVFRASDTAAFMPGLRGLLDKAVGRGLPARKYPDIGAFALAGSEERAEAIWMADQVLAEDPAAIGVLCLKGDLLADDGRADEARACYERAIGEKPGSMAGYEHKLILLQDAGDRAGIIECLDAAIGVAPDSEDDARGQESMRYWRGVFGSDERAAFGSFPNSSGVEWHLARRRERTTYQQAVRAATAGHAQPTPHLITADWNLR